MRRLSTTHQLCNAHFVIPAHERGSVTGHGVPTDHILEIRVSLMTDPHFFPLSVMPDRTLAAFVVVHRRSHVVGVWLSHGVEAAAEAKGRQ